VARAIFWQKKKDVWRTLYPWWRKLDSEEILDALARIQGNICAIPDSVDSRVDCGLSGNFLMEPC